jgi:hypothetical protein
MSDYNHLPPSKPASRRQNNQPVFCVGWKAFVNWPQRPLPVPLLDSHGQPLANDLVDGQEVEILSWRPKSAQGSLYQVRRLVDHTEWWIAAIHLRRRSDAPVAAQTGG